MLRRAMMAANAGPPPAPGQPPSAYAGLTLWYDGDSSIHYVGTQTTDPVAGDGQSVVRADSAGGIARGITRIGGDYTRRAPIVGASGGMDLSNPNGRVQPKTGTGLNPPVAASTLLSVSNACIVVALRVDSAPGNIGEPWENGVIFGEENRNLGLHFYQSGGTIHFQAYNFASADASVSTTEAAAAWVIITLKHAGGQLRIRKNGGTWSSIASGNTFSLSGQALFFNGNGDIKLAQLCTYNANRSDAELLEVERYFGAKVGLTI